MTEAQAVGLLFIMIGAFGFSRELSVETKPDIVHVMFGLALWITGIWLVGNAG